MRGTKCRGLRLQSAMEYLMTYGWSILIIAVVLGVLFQLGVFNSTNFAPRATPGSCRVLKTSGMANLEGICNGQLPKYVAQFNGQSSTINFGAAAILSPSTAQTVVVWFTLGAYAPASQWPSSVSNSQWGIYEQTLTSGVGSYVTTNPGAATTWCSISPPGANVPLNTWHQYVQTYDGANIITYYDGQSQYAPCSKTGTMVPGILYIGSTNFNGGIANVQIYDTSLSSSYIQALYLEGVGGVPVLLQNLIGWWPLNGDTNDYSSNNDNGAPTAIAYISQYGK